MAVLLSSRNILSGHEEELATAAFISAKTQKCLSRIALTQRADLDSMSFRYHHNQRAKASGAETQAHALVSYRRM